MCAGYSGISVGIVHDSEPTLNDFFLNNSSALYEEFFGRRLKGSEDTSAKMIVLVTRLNRVEPSLRGLE